MTDCGGRIGNPHAINGAILGRSCSLLGSAGLVCATAHAPSTGPQGTVRRIRIAGIRADPFHACRVRSRTDRLGAPAVILSLTLLGRLLELKARSQASTAIRPLGVAPNTTRLLPLSRLRPTFSPPPWGDIFKDSIINEPSMLLIRKAFAASAQAFTVTFTVNLSGTSIGAHLRAVLRRTHLSRSIEDHRLVGRS